MTNNPKMDSDLKPQLKKSSFKLKEKTSGNILTIHHTIKENDKMLRIIMCVGCFDSRNSQLAAIDRRGTIFVFDFTTKQHWRLTETLPKPTVIIASRSKNNQYIAGNKEGKLVLIDVELAAFVNATKISNYAINEISYPGQPLEPKNLALIRTGALAVIIDLDSFACTHRLDFDKPELSLKFASYLPQSEQIITCFNNDSIHIWGVSLDVIRIVYPIRLRDKQLQTNSDNIQEFCLDFEKCEGIAGDFCVNKNLCDGLISCYAYQNDGSSMAFSTWDNYILFLSPYTFELTSMLRCKDFALTQLALLAKPNDTLVLALTNRAIVVLLDCSNTEFKLIVELDTSRSLNLSLDCKYISICRTSGELAVWSVCHLVNVLKSQRECMTILRAAFKQNKHMKLPNSDMECKFQDEVKKLLTPHRLQQILQEFSCFPAKYRSLIWCSLLQLPNNKVQYQELLQMGTPLPVTQKTRSIQLKNDNLKRALIKCWSSLSQWCKVLAYNETLPDLIFPFVKMFQQNSLITFEICASLVINQFQLFFEYHPLEPSNYLGLCANILEHYDKTLFEFFKSKDVTTTIYAWSLLRNSFSEVIDEDQWMCLWDNILSAPIYYPIFVVVAYNIMQKEILMRLPDKFIIERFYHEQNPIDIRKLIAKSYKLLEKCPLNLHPKRYMQNFQALPANVYPKFLNYPKQCLTKFEEKAQDVQDLQSAIDTRMRTLELEELKVIRRLENGMRQEEHTKRMKEVEKYYQEALRREEERINCQRKMLLLYQKEIRQRKGEVAVVMQETEQRKTILAKEHELNCLQSYIEQERMRNDINLMWAEEELYNQDLDLLVEKSMGQYLTPSLSAKYNKDIKRLCGEQKLLNNDLRKISSTSTTMPAAAASRTKTKSSPNHLEQFERELEKCQNEFLSLTGRKTS